MSTRIGIVAGRGDLPERVIAACRADGRDPFVIGLKDQADPDKFAAPPDAWIRLGEAGKGIRLLREAGAVEVVLVGGVRRPSLAALRPDAWTARFLARVGRAYFRDDSLLGALAGMIEEEGFRLVAPEALASSLLAEHRLYGGPPVDEAARADIARGIEVARALGRLDVGQAAIVQTGHVLGVEGPEGTDALIARCAALRLDGPGGVLVKVCKPGQERRIDLPTVGPATVEAAAAGGLRGIAVEAGAALIVDAEALGRAADAAGVFVLGIDPDA